LVGPFLFTVLTQEFADKASDSSKAGTSRTTEEIH
jgi:hypothetical protein